MILLNPMKASKISIDNAKIEKLFYFVANVVVYRASDGRCLILKRGENEKVHPSKWGVPGGKLEWKDLDINNPTRMNGDVIDFEDAVERLLEREAFEEAGIKIKGPLTFINDVVFIRPDETPVVSMKFAAQYKSGEVKIEEWAFSDSAWVNSEEVRNYDCIGGIEDEIDATIKLFEKKS